MPAFNDGFHHSRIDPLPTSQFTIVALLNELPDETTTSKYFPAALKLGAPTGSAAYRVAVSVSVPSVPPTAVAVTSPEALVAVPPDETFDATEIDADDGK